MQGAEKVEVLNEEEQIVQVGWINKSFLLGHNCMSGGLYSCLNGGSCGFDGICVCAPGYTGLTCGTCEILKIKYLKKH